MPKSRSTTPTSTRRRSTSVGRRNTRSTAIKTPSSAASSNGTAEENEEIYPPSRTRSRSRPKSRAVTPISRSSAAPTKSSDSVGDSFKIVHKPNVQKNNYSLGNKNSFYQLIKKNAYLIMGLFLFGVGSMILLTQLEADSPLVRFLEGSFDAFQKSEYADNLSSYSNIGHIKEIKLKNEHFSGLIASLGAVVILLGGHLYFVSTTIEVENLPTAEASVPEHTLDTRPTARSDPLSASSSSSRQLPSSRAAPSTGAYELPGDSISNFMAQVYKYQRLMRERSLRFNLALFVKYVRFHWFRIGSACVVMCLFWLARFAYTERVYLHRTAVIVGVNLVRTLVASAVALVVGLGLWYYFRYRYVKSRVIQFLAQAAKRRLEQVHRQGGHEEYPVEFVQEELVELVSAALLHAQEAALSPPGTSVATAGATPNTPHPGAIVSATAGRSASSTPGATARPVSTPVAQRTWIGWLLGYKRPMKARYTAADVEDLGMPHDLLSDIKPAMVRRYWKDVQQTVEKDARIQMITRVYNGKPRTRCWRRLDLVRQLSVTEQHARSLSQHRSGGTRPVAAADEPGEPDWVQRITAGFSGKGTPVAKSGLEY